MSVIHRRQPGKFCGPGIFCSTKNADTSKIVKPPGENGVWVDGLNTFIEEKQGVKHVENYETLFPPDDNTGNTDGNTNNDNGNTDDDNNGGAAGKL